jgi:hypothetical protein
MRKKLALIVLALAAFAAANTTSSASVIISPCPKGSHLFRCPTYSFCCPNNAFCICVPR